MGERKAGGNIKQVVLADGTVRYRLKFYVGLDDDGKREFHNETFDTEREAKDKAASLRVARAGGDSIKPSKQTLTAFLKQWLRDEKEGDIRPRTLYDYQNVLSRYIYSPPKGTPALGRTRLNKLHPVQFQTLYSYMRNTMGLSPRTIRYLRTILHGALDHAVTLGLRATNPTAKARARKRKRVDGDEVQDASTWEEKKPTAMNRSQAHAFQEASREDRYHALWVLLLHTGMRPSEALGLRWKDVNLETRELHVRQILTRRGVKTWRLMPPKTKRSARCLTLGPSIVRALLQWREQQAAERNLLGSEWEDTGLVFSNEFGRPLDQGNLNSRNFRRICAAAHQEYPDLGMGTWVEKGEEKVFKPTFWTYCLRHTYASLLLEAGVDLKTVSQRLGHESEILTLTTYQHVLPTMETRAMERAEAIFTLPDTDPDRLYTFGTEAQKQDVTGVVLGPTHLA